MRRYRYTDTQPRYYPDLGLNAEPGGEYDLAEAPDGCFVTAKPTASKPGKPTEMVPDEIQEEF